MTFSFSHEDMHRYGPASIGPFGISVLVSEDSQEYTRIFFTRSSIKGSSKPSVHVVCDTSRFGVMGSPHSYRWSLHFLLHCLPLDSQLRILT